MKFFIQFITASFLSGYLRAAELPYQDYLTIEEAKNYRELIGLMSTENLHDMIKSDLEAQNRIFNDVPEPGQPVHVERRIPFAELMTPQQLAKIRRIADFLDDDELLLLVQPILAASFYGNHFQQHHHEHYHQGQYQHHRHHPGNMRFVDPTKMTDEEFDAYLANGDNFTQASMNALYAEGDVNNLTDARQMKMIMAAATHDEPIAFELLVGACEKTVKAASSDELSDILLEITAERKDRAFLRALLKDCDHHMARMVGMYMHRGNSKFHQLFMNQCGAHIDPDVGKNLVGVEIPAKVQKSWNEAAIAAKSSYIVNFVPVNAGAPPESGATLIHQSGNIQVAGFFSKPEVLTQHPKLHKTISALEIERILAPLARTEHFCVVHLDFEAGKAKVFRSYDAAGPGIAIIHINDTGEGFYSQDLGDLYLNKRTTWIHTEDIHPTDVVVGMSEDYVSTVNRGFSSGIMDSMRFLYNLDCVENVVSDVILIAAPKKAHHVMVGIVPAVAKKKEVKEEKWTEEKVKADPVAQTTSSMKTEHVTNIEPSGATMTKETSKKEKFSPNETVVSQFTQYKVNLKAANRSIENYYMEDIGLDLDDDPSIKLIPFDDDEAVTEIEDQNSTEEDSLID